MNLLLFYLYKEISYEKMRCHTGQIDMLNYFLRRLMLMIPTLFGILSINYIIVQAAPGGPVEQMIAKVRGQSVDATARIAGNGDLMHNL